MSFTIVKKVEKMECPIEASTVIIVGTDSFLFTMESGSGEWKKIGWVKNGRNQKKSPSLLEIYFQ